MFAFRRYKTLVLRLISSLQGQQQSLSLEIKPVGDAEQCCPHDNIVRIHLCDECMKSILPIVCRMPESPFFDCSCKFVDRPQNVWSPNSCQVQAFLRQSVSILVIILQLIQVLPVFQART